MLRQQKRNPRNRSSSSALPRQRAKQEKAARRTRRSHAAETATESTGGRKPGRPRTSRAQQAENEELVLAAAERVYGGVNYHEVTVEHILTEAGISRPTFYRWFSGKDEVLTRIVRRANDNLIQRMYAAMSEDDDLLGRIAAGVEAYIRWGLDTGPIVLALCRDARLPGSPVQRDRGRLGEATLALYVNQMRKLGRPDIHPLVYQAVIAAIEHVGSWLFSQSRPREADIALARKVMLRIAQAVLAEGPEREAIPELPR